MGLFSNSKEDELIDLYSGFYGTMGVSDSEAKEMAKDLLEAAKEMVKQNGEDKWPEDIADQFFSNPSFAKKLEVEKKDGVKEEDFRWWLSMDPLERNMMRKMDEFHKTNMVISKLQEGKEMEEAMQTVEKYHPVFGDPENEKNQKGENRPLPEPLKDRINIYIEKRAREGTNQYKKDIEASTSFNALIRKEIKAGNI